METEELNELIIKKLDGQLESLKYTLESIVETYSTVSMLLQLLIKNKTINKVDSSTHQ
jgi:hypothetical protein